jgi:hypothetical protein
MQHELIAFVVLRELTRLPEQSSSSWENERRRRSLSDVGLLPALL